MHSIKSDIDLLKVIAGNIKDKSVSDSLNELSEKVSSNRFYLVVVGLFKRCKSSIHENIEEALGRIRSDQETIDAIIKNYQMQEDESEPDENRLNSSAN